MHSADSGSVAKTPMEQSTFVNICNEMADQKTLIAAYQASPEARTAQVVKKIARIQEKIEGMYAVIDLLGWRHDVDKIVEDVMPRRISRIPYLPPITHPQPNMMATPTNVLRGHRVVGHYDDGPDLPTKE